MNKDNAFDRFSEDKIQIILEYFLSLHEADEVFNAIFDVEYNCEDIEVMLDEYIKRNDNGKII